DLGHCRDRHDWRADRFGLRAESMRRLGAPKISPRRSAPKIAKATFVASCRIACGGLYKPYLKISGSFMRSHGGFGVPPRARDNHAMAITSSGTPAGAGLNSLLPQAPPLVFYWPPLSGNSYKT